MLLAIDTSAGTSVAVLDDAGQVIAERSTPDTRRHAEIVGSFFADLAPTNVRAVVVGVGPGPFTGLRVGIAAARGYAWGADVPLWPVLSHDAIALDRFEAGESGPLIVATDARRREFFVTEYSGLRSGIPERSVEPRIESQLVGSITLADTVSAASLGRIAHARAAHGVPFDSADAVYLRSPDVTMPNPRPEHA